MESASATSNFCHSEDYSLRQTKIYCEDDYFSERCSASYHLSCDSTTQIIPEPPLDFNYHKFNEYIRLKLQIECFNRSVEASKGVLSPGLDYYTDKRLQEELFQVYGDLDENSAQFQRMFQNYKEQRLEQIEEWVKVEVKVAQRRSDNGAFQQYQEFIDEDEYFLMHFTQEEIASFKTVATGTSKSFHPFMLPRKTNAELGNIEHGHHERLPENKRNRNSRKSGHLAQRNELVLAEVQKVLQQHSAGLTRDKLLQICNERLGRKAPPGVFINLNSDMIDGYLTKEKILSAKPFFQGGGLIFPHFNNKWLLSVAPSVNPLDELWELRHKLLVILNLCLGIVEVGECVDLCSIIFQNAIFPYEDWGFETKLDLVEWLFIQKWTSYGVEVISLGCKGKRGEKHYLAVMSDKRRALIEKQMTVVASNKTRKAEREQSHKVTKNVPKLKEEKAISSTSSKIDKHPIPQPGSSSGSSWKQPQTSAILKEQSLKPPILNYDPSATFIDSKYVQVGQKIIREENEIKPGTEFDCVVSLVNSPTNFYLVRTTKWRQLDRLFHELKEYWINHPTALSPHPQFLQRNYLCMAKTDNEKDVEVYRVVILGKPDVYHYQVFCIDYGDMLKVRHDQLRYLTRDFLYTLDAQAISCSMYNVSSSIKDPKTGSDVWNKGVSDYTKKLLCPPSDDLPIVKVLFKQKMNGTGRWLVKVSSSKRSDFGEDVMKFVNKGKTLT